MLRTGELGSALLGAMIAPLSSGANWWQAPRLPCQEGRCSPRCQTEIIRNAQAHGSGRHSVRRPSRSFEAANTHLR
eukprot:5015598-Prymnesium_polylepis.1